jgi:hypothetical protein
VHPATLNAREKPAADLQAEKLREKFGEATLSSAGTMV